MKYEAEFKGGETVQIELKVRDDQGDLTPYQFSGIFIRELNQNNVEVRIGGIYYSVKRDKVRKMP